MRLTILSSLLCFTMALASPGATAQDAATAQDKTSGYALILAADYQGPSGKLYLSVQQDAIRAYQTMVCDWHLRPDHIVLLAEGDAVTKFVQDKTLSDNINDLQAGFDTAYNASMREVAADNGATEREKAFGALYDDKQARKIPLYGKPTLANFQLARDTITHLAQPKQMVALVLSGHAAPTTDLMALQSDASGKIVESLPASEVKLTGCAAATRLVLMDVSNRDLQEYIPPVAGNQGIAFEDLHHQLAEGGKATAVILSSSDGMHLSWPTTWPSDHAESAFLKAAFDNLREGQGNLGQAFATIQKRFGASIIAPMRRLKAANIVVGSLLVPAPKFYPPAAQNLDVHTALNLSSDLPHEDVALVAPDAVPPPAVLPTVKPGVVRAPILVGNNVITTLYGTDINQIKGRAGEVVQRVQALLSVKKLTRQDVAQIQPGTRNGQNVVLMPHRVDYKDSQGKKVDYIITADAKLAQLSNCDPQQLASMLAQNLRNVISTNYVSSQGEKEKTERDWMSFGMQSLVAAQNDTDDQKRQQDYAEAAQDFEKAREVAPEFVQAYLELGSVYLNLGKTEEAKNVLGDLDDLVKVPGIHLAPDQQDEYQQLRSKLN